MATPPSPTGSYTLSPAEVPVSAPPGVKFGWHLRTATSTGRKMAVASRAVMMAVRTEARRVEVEQEGYSSHWVLQKGGVVGSVFGWEVGVSVVGGSPSPT